MRRQICALAVRICHKQVFSWPGLYGMAYKLFFRFTITYLKDLISCQHLWSYHQVLGSVLILLCRPDVIPRHRILQLKLTIKLRYDYGGLSSMRFGILRTCVLQPLNRTKMGLQLDPYTCLVCDNGRIWQDWEEVLLFINSCDIHVHFHTSCLLYFAV